MNSYAYDPADGVCSYKAYVAASSADEMHVPALISSSFAGCHFADASD